jgi:hypothetical protein
MMGEMILGFAALAACGVIGAVFGVVPMLFALMFLAFFALTAGR